MPNWVTTSYNVSLPTKNVKRFLNYFLTSDEVDKLRGRYLYRTFIDEGSIFEVESVPGTTCLSFVASSAWSLDSILEDHTDDKGRVVCPSLYWVCQDCEVIILDATGDEPGMCFKQRLHYDNSMDYVEIETEDVTLWQCEECYTCGYWEDYDEDIDRTVCPECGHKLEEEEND